MILIRLIFIAFFITATYLILQFWKELKSDEYAERCVLTLFKAIVIMIWIIALITTLVVLIP